jgi:hypothetical protein
MDTGTPSMSWVHSMDDMHGIDGMILCMACISWYTQWTCDWQACCVVAFGITCSLMQAPSRRSEMRPWSYTFSGSGSTWVRLLLPDQILRSRMSSCREVTAGSLLLGELNFYNTGELFGVAFFQHGASRHRRVAQEQVREGCAAVLA